MTWKKSKDGKSFIITQDTEQTESQEEAWEEVRKGFAKIYEHTTSIVQALNISNKLQQSFTITRTKNNLPVGITCGIDCGCNSFKECEMDKTNFTDTKQMAEDCWLFLTDNKDKSTISKEAFLHEVGAMLESVKQYSLTQNSKQ